MTKSFLEKLMIIGRCIQETFNESEDEQEVFELEYRKKIEKQKFLFEVEKQKEIEEQKLLFNNMFARAIFILENAKPDESAYSDPDYKHPIFSYIKVLGLSIQTKYITNIIYGRAPQRGPEFIEFFNFFHLFNGQTLWDIVEKTKIPSLEEDVKLKKDVKLARDLILPCPWNHIKFTDALIKIGQHNTSKAWKQDSNHDIYLMQPVGVCCVNSGNHSIMAGIVKGEGIITKYEMIDIRPLYSLMYSDGVNYYRKADDTILEAVGNVEFAVIFEIGRKLNELNISW
ncbi:hypothetical protein PaeCFBP13512_18535 [Paenibacillus sp. CFBP13512]|uniref:DUF6710 family protein n=1 Tax=Paenibacillus sp. CFBP13512 TaxID=2184007 RepID=UPI0010C1488D|nr:DUF6710 family protein [Paenibacillus sp. CFBP13512]TKJ87220.1 hypothetical protein PaeCFBP13512_18535 [Paenibacillus sp. CFBP13512]